jgi:ABC-type multidrug transport system ATPase subunit
MLDSLRPPATGRFLGGDLVLSIRNLTKTYPGGVRALRGITLDIPPGMFGLLGPNGAGKSTLMKILATLLEPDSGSAHLDSLDLIADKNATRRLLGYLPQEFGVYPKMSAMDLLNHLAIMKGVTGRGERKQLVEGLLQQTNLWDFRKKTLGGYSGGMKQRFGIAQALLANPKLVIVDEPTAGLDPAERNRFLNLLSSIGRNVVVILSTHIVDDVRELCSRMAMISNGELLIEGAPAKTLEAIKGRIWTKIVATDSEREALERSMQVVSTHLVGGQHELRRRLLAGGCRSRRRLLPHSGPPSAQLTFKFRSAANVSRLFLPRVEAAVQEHLNLCLLPDTFPRDVFHRFRARFRSRR